MQNLKFQNSFKTGVKDGIPIALGYLSVSFAFGMTAVSGGLPIGLALLISMTNLTSAGQVAGLSIMLKSGSLIETAFTQLIINLRYSLMSVSVSQKLHESVTLRDRFLISFGMTDEIFAVTCKNREEVGKKYLYGLILLPYIGWALGTLLGAVASTLLPAMVQSALGLAIYGMFIAIFLPPMKSSMSVTLVVVIAAVLSCCFNFLPLLNKVSSGFVITICAAFAAIIGAVIKPVDDKEDEL
jgi:4-azaleucine resistance transporter AzlC